MFNFKQKPVCDYILDRQCHRKRYRSNTICGFKDNPTHIFRSGNPFGCSALHSELISHSLCIVSSQTSFKSNLSLFQGQIFSLSSSGHFQQTLKPISPPKAMLSSRHYNATKALQEKAGPQPRVRPGSRPLKHTPAAYTRAKGPRHRKRSGGLVSSDFGQVQVPE